MAKGTNKLKVKYAKNGAVKKVKGGTAKERQLALKNQSEASKNKIKLAKIQGDAMAKITQASGLAGMGTTLAATLGQAANTAASNNKNANVNVKISGLDTKTSSNNDSTGDVLDWIK